jgi:hypothetical protein
MTLKNICYGCKVESPELIETMIRKAHVYRNLLCEAELLRRQQYNEMLLAMMPGLVAVDVDIDSLTVDIKTAREEIQKERQLQRTKNPTGVKSIQESIRQLREKRKELYALRKDFRASAKNDPTISAAIANIDAGDKENRKRIKAESGLYWGTEAITSMAASSFRSGTPPKFARFTGEGQLAVQCQGGMQSHDVFNANTLVYFGDRIGKRTECFFRIASDERGKPIFGRLLVCLHRDIPVGKIKWAYLERRKVADNVRWKIRVTLEQSESTPSVDSGKWVAVHFGWSMAAGRLRTMLWQGYDGKQGALILDAKHLADYEKLDLLRSETDLKFNEAREEFAVWLKANDPPEWMHDYCSHIHAWRSPSRFAGLMLRWRDNRFAGDEDAFDRFWELHKAAKHKWQHSSRLSFRVAKRREWIYRNAVKELSDRYNVCFAGQVGVKELTALSEPEDLKADNTKANRQERWAAISILSRFVAERFHLRMINVDTKNLTQQCSNCGEINKVNGPKVQCHGCGKTWHPDDNAMANTIARGEAALKSGGLLELQAAQADKDRKAMEKLAKMQEANRAARKRKLDAQKSGG